MKKRFVLKIATLLLCMTLAAAAAFSFTACSRSEPSPQTTAEDQTSASPAATEVGSGKTKFTFTVVDGQGKETVFEVSTDKENVGDALQELGLISGEESQYGLYVKTVIGITADYNVDQTYWAWYVNGEMASVGVDQTPVTAGGNYAFKVSK